MAWSDGEISSTDIFTSTLRTAKYAYQQECAVWNSQYTRPYEVKQIKFTACTYDQSWSDSSNTTFNPSTGPINGLYFQGRAFRWTDTTYTTYEWESGSSWISTSTINLAKATNTSTYTLTFASPITIMPNYSLLLKIYYPSTYNSIDYTIKTSGTVSTTIKMQIAPANCVYIYNENENVWKRSIPYIYTGSEWVPAIAYVYNNGDWRETSV